jgi:hypothetical protein
MILDEMCIVSFTFSYVTVCRLCAVHCVFIIGFYVLFCNYWTYAF